MPNSELSKLTTCYIFGLPAELRVKIYSLVFQDSELEEDRNITRREDSSCDHSDHMICRQVWSEDKPHLLLDPNIETNFEMFGVPTSPIPLLSTCRAIRREATQELYRNLELKVETRSCTPRRLASLQGIKWQYLGSSCNDQTFKTFRGEALKQLVAKADLTVQIRRGNPYGWGYCSTCAYGLEGVIERFPVLLKYFCSQMRHVDFDVFFEKPACVANNLQRLVNVADALDKDCAIESIRLTTESKADWRGPNEWKKLEEKWIRDWKRGAYKLSKQLPPSRARTLLWKAIDGTFKDVSGKPRQWCKLEEIHDSRLVKPSAKSRAARRDGERGRVEYLVIRDGHWRPQWEPQRCALPQWQAMVVRFHEKHPNAPKPSEIAGLLTRKENEPNTNTSSILATATSSANAVDSEEADVEDDLAFAIAMSKRTARK